ncbi:hypothetical protein PV328_002658 [Microctonus aethiopoides]|uniref:Large ribosomal subunit protein mL40 n=1 Tax=Microctonus aethiopoides TaxID=144406 RepID=A0AA39F6R3_9HYME|nr:hypothetical protein PV328_002658 [Microctonus aethiopoides]
MAITNILTGFSRLSLNTIRQSVVRGISTTNNNGPLCFRATNILFGEPLKKKKRIDPAVIRHRIERKRRKLEKQIRRLEKVARQFKPIEEMEIPVKLIDEKATRTRPSIKLTEDILEERALLQKKWTLYKQRQHMNDMQIIENMLSAQSNALNELRNESEELYQAAVQVDTLSILPHCSNEPAAIVDTPPIKNYTSPDGNYTNITMKFEGERIFE